MSNMLRSLFTAFATALLPVLLEPFWSAALLSIGLDTAKLAPPVVYVTRWALMQWWFVPAVMVVLGIAIGTWLDTFARSQDSKLIEKCIDLGRGDLAQIVRILRRYVQMINDNEWDGTEPPTTTRLNTVNSAMISAQISMRKLRIKPPLYQVPSVDPVRFILQNYKYLEPLQTLMAAGHLKEARQVSAIFYKSSAVGESGMQTPQGNAT